ncbi:MAG: TIGR03084 family metal-binding protein [Hyphomicrobiaceae bacterium]|nr:TIGR03084 family metal-binding protein [Hyphomicrobiaceae bacterium]
MKQIDDFRAEVADLSAVLAPLSPAGWETVTQFKGYTINDVVRHLHQGDQLALTSAERPDKFGEVLERRRQQRKEGLTPRDDARREYGHLAGPALLEVWRDTAERLCTTLSALGPDARLKWAGPDMGVRMFTTARQMEVWAHGQEIHDILGLDRAPTERLENIAVIGVRTFGWTFVNRGLPVPSDGPPHVRLTSPSGAAWQWHVGSTAGHVTGTALDFCQTVTQVRNVADTGLQVAGDSAERWMAIAQCFAGAPNDPPAKGTRRKVINAQGRP